MAGSNLQMAATDQEMAGAGPQMAGADLQMAGAGPQMAGADQEMAGAGPQMAGADQQMAGAGQVSTDSWHVLAQKFQRNAHVQREAALKMQEWENLQPSWNFGQHKSAYRQLRLWANQQLEWANKLKGWVEYQELETYAREESCSLSEQWDRRQLEYANQVKEEKNSATQVS